MKSDPNTDKCVMDSVLTESVRNLLLSAGENPDREGLIDTPKRHLKSFAFMTSGYQQDVRKLINDALFESSSQNMVIVKDIEFYSLCEHHLVPFFGKCHVAYIPNKKIVGLSKIPRIVDAFARRLQVQERLTKQIADCLMEHLSPLGVSVVMEANHLCMMMRGVEKQGALTITSSVLGDFENPVTRAEFFTLLR
jgi:GTP cyclohydrolase I